MCDCGCECCSGDDIFDDGPRTPPAEGTMARVMYDFYAQKIAERFNSDGLLFSKLYGR